MQIFENLGFDFVTEEEDTYIGFINAVCQEGKVIEGYYEYPYINREYGWPQFIARTKVDEEEKKILVVGMDTHMSGITTWNCLLSGMNIQPKDADVLSRRVALKRASDGGGLAVVNLVNADVLPSFMENDPIRVQMVGFPTYIRFYADEAAYEADQPEGANGKKILLADGAMFPSGLLRNHAPDNPDNDKDHLSDNIMLICGTVKKIYNGIIRLDAEPFQGYICAVINTEYGDLEIALTLEQVAEEDRENLKEGAMVCGSFILSGDVAVGDYADGIVRDESHNLALLRYTLQGGDPKRLRAVLKDDSVYVSEANKKAWVGYQDISDRLQYVRDANPGKAYFAHFATITDVDDGDEELPYGVGQRCVILAEEEEDNYVSIAFLDMDEEGYVTKLTISVNGRYHFKVDEPMHPKNVLDDFKMPESVAEPILSLLHFHGFLDYEIENEEVLGRLKNIKTYESNAQQILDALEDHPEVEDGDKYANIFGYLFAKSIESDYSWRHGDNEQFRLVVSFSPEDAITGEIYTNLQPAVEEKVKVAYDYGKQFYKDLQVFCSMHKECSFDEELLKALVIVQQIGEIYSQTKLLEE